MLFSRQNSTGSSHRILNQRVAVSLPLLLFLLPTSAFPDKAGIGDKLPMQEAFICNLTGTLGWNQPRLHRKSDSVLSFRDWIGSGSAWKRDSGFSGAPTHLCETYFGRGGRSMARDGRETQPCLGIPIMRMDVFIMGCVSRLKQTSVHPMLHFNRRKP